MIIFQSVITTLNFLFFIIYNPFLYFLLIICSIFCFVNIFFTYSNQLKIVTLNAKGSESLPTHYFFTTKRATLAPRPFCKVCIYR